MQGGADDKQLSDPLREVRRGVKHEQDDGIFYGMEGDSFVHLLLMSRVFCRKFSIYLR